MLRTRLPFLLVLSFILAVSVTAFSQAKPQIKMGAVKDISPTDGKAMFQGYCAPCHGMSGKGDGPAAKALAPKPANLTEFAKRRDGKFSDRDFEDKLNGVGMAPAHGSSDMPVWGPVFRQLGNEQLRMANLRTYVQSLQVKQPD
jgi:mono/diheme cytochrome c family protein